MRRERCRSDRWLLLRGVHPRRYRSALKETRGQTDRDNGTLERSLWCKRYAELSGRLADPILKRRDRTPTITVQSDHDDAVQQPQVVACTAKGGNALKSSTRLKSHAATPSLNMTPAFIRMIRSGDSVWTHLTQRYIGFEIELHAYYH
jgi:hypothetical protein